MPQSGPVSYCITAPISHPTVFFDEMCEKRGIRSLFYSVIYACENRAFFWKSWVFQMTRDKVTCRHGFWEEIIASSPWNGETSSSTMQLSILWCTQYTMSQNHTISCGLQKLEKKIALSKHSTCCSTDATDHRLHEPKSGDFNLQKWQQPEARHGQKSK